MRDLTAGPAVLGPRTALVYRLQDSGCWLDQTWLIVKLRSIIFMMPLMSCLSSKLLGYSRSTSLVISGLHLSQELARLGPLVHVIRPSLTPNRVGVYMGLLTSGWDNGCIEGGRCA